MYSWVDHANRVLEWIYGCDARGRGLRVPDNDRVMHANDLVGRWPKDVTWESMGLSDRVRMWMRTSMSNSWIRVQQN